MEFILKHAFPLPSGLVQKFRGNSDLPQMARSYLSQIIAENKQVSRSEARVKTSSKWKWWILLAVFVVSVGLVIGVGLVAEALGLIEMLAHELANTR